ncbi:MAG: glycosyltransferase family 4 protein [Actinomycetota bacterium]
MIPTRVAQLMPDVRPYRVGFYERLEQRPDVSITIYAGHPNPGHGGPTSRPATSVPVVDVRNHFYSRRSLKILWQTGALRMLRSDAEVIVCQEVVSNLSVWAIRLLHRWAGKRLVLMGFFYRPDGNGLTAALRDRMRSFLRASASAFVAYTEQGRDELLSHGIPEDSVFVTKNTLDTEHLMRLAQEVGEPASEAVLRRLDIPKDATVLAFVGRLRPIKKVEVAIEAVRILNHRQENSVALIVIGDGGERASLEAAAKGAMVRFVGQTYDDAELAKLLSVASLLVLPGSVGLTCVLAFSNGLPVITTDAAATTQTPEFAYVRDEENGVVLGAPDAELYADAIEELLADHERLKRLTAGAHEAAQALRMERMVDAFVAAIRH